MFCQKCGAQLDGNGLCRYCSTKYSGQSLRHHKEMAVLEVLPELEESSINCMMCFGWLFETNHSISKSYGGIGFLYALGAGGFGTKITTKLTFSRHTSMPNYDILNSLYNRFIPLHNERTKFIKRMRHAFNWPMIILGIAIGVALFTFFIGNKNTTAINWFNDFLTIAYILLGIVLGGLVGWLIGIPFMRAKLKKWIAEVSEEIDDLCREALKYEI